jgi:hypothetical protein
MIGVIRWRRNHLRLNRRLSRATFTNVIKRFSESAEESKAFESRKSVRWQDWNVVSMIRLTWAANAMKKFVAEKHLIEFTLRENEKQKFRQEWKRSDFDLNSRFFELINFIESFDDFCMSNWQQQTTTETENSGRLKTRFNGKPNELMETKPDTFNIKRT